MFFENMGFDKENIGRLLARCPEIFAASISNTLQRKIDFLSRICLSKAYLPVVIKKYPELLVFDIDRTLPQRYSSNSSQFSFFLLLVSHILAHPIILRQHNFM